MNKTRNRRRRELLENIVSGLIVFVVVFVATFLLCGMAFQIWATHPAEQPITYEQHIANMNGGGSK